MRNGFEDKFKLVLAMGSSYLSEYQSFRDKIAPHIQATAFVHDDIFTSHGYDHSVRVLRALNTILGDDFYADVNEEEIYLLACACVVHDVGMILDPKRRSEHAQVARDWILNQSAKLGETQLGQIVRPWSPVQGNIIAEIVS